MRITISGPPGSGKTTVAEIVSERIGLGLILTGKVFREQAVDAGMDVLEYNRLAERDHSIDEKLDAEIIRLARMNENSVVEGRLAGQLLMREGISALKVFVTAPARVRAERIVKREATDIESETKMLIDRESSERKRYIELYGVDIDDMSVYDLVIDSTDISAEEAAQIVIDEVSKRRK